MEGSVNFLNLEYFFAKLAALLAGIYEFFFASDTCLEYNLRGDWYCIYERLSANWPIYLLIFTISALLLLWIIYSIMRKKDIDEEEAIEFEEHFIKYDQPAPKNPAWERIQKLFESNNPSDWRVAIIEADSLLDRFIMSLDYPGETMGERMQNINAADFPMINAAWEAHKVRNRIAHEGSGYQIDAREAHIVYRLYEAVFRDTNYI